uniref:Uncharacterized protein n=1 Tax=Pelusios castaneus TaxID=367368 RepID=A0A8C8VQX4_9SAUR
MGGPVYSCPPAPTEEAAARRIAGTKSPDLSNQNSDQANEEWETASESSDFAERRGGGPGEKEPGGPPPQAFLKGASTSGAPTLGGRAACSDLSLAQRKELSKRSFSSQRPGMDRQNRRTNPGPGSGGKAGGRGGASGGRGDKRSWPSPRNRRPAEERPPGLSLPPAPTTSAVYRLDRVVPSDPAGIRQALAEIGSRQGSRTKQPPHVPASGPAPPFRPHPGAYGTEPPFLAKSQLLPSNAQPLVDTPLPKRRERPHKQEDPVGYSHSHSFPGPTQEPPGSHLDQRGSNSSSEGLAPHIWSRMQASAPRKSYQPRSMEPWMDPLNTFDDVACTEMSQSDSGVDLSSDSQVSSATCSQRSSPDGGLTATPEPGVGGKHGPEPGAPGVEPKEQGRRPPPRDTGPPRDAKVCSPPPIPAGPGPIGAQRPQRTEKARESMGGSELGPEPAAPGPLIQFGASNKDADLGLPVSERGKQALEPPPALPSAIPEGLVATPRDWELLLPTRLPTAPQPGPGRPCEPRALPPGPAACPPAEPSAFSGERRPYPELFYSSQPTVAQQVPSASIESQLSGSFRPGTPSLHPYRSQPLYLQPSPAPGSPAAPVLPGSALLSGVALKGQYVEFSALPAADLAKLPAAGLLYQAAPPFLYSPPFCGSQLGPDQPLLQMRQELSPPSDFYPGPLPQASQSSFLQAPGPAQQMLLPVVESQLPPVVNFSSLQQGAPAAPPPLPLVPVAPALRPPGQLAGRLLPSAVRAFPHGMGRTELHPREMKPFPEYRKLSSPGGRAPAGGRVFTGSFSPRLQAPGSSYSGATRNLRPASCPVVSQSDVLHWPPRPWQRHPLAREGPPVHRPDLSCRPHQSDKQEPGRAPQP